MLDYIPSFVRWARFPVIVIIMCALAGCAGVASRHTTHPYTPVSVNPDMRRDVVIMALAQLGTRYRYGGATPATGFDCSGLVQYVFGAAADTRVPHSTSQIAEASRSISKHDLSPGDLVFFNTLHRRYSHVGIYLGDGRFINAPSSGEIGRAHV